MKAPNLICHTRWLRLLVLLLINSTCFGYPIGTRIRCNTATLKVRNGAGGTEVGARTTGDTGTVAAGPTNAVLSGTTYTWFQVDWDSGVDGWSWVAGFNSISNPQTAATVAGLAYNAGFRGWDLV